MPILSDSSKSIITENGSRPPYDKMMFSSSVENRKRHTFGSTQGGSSPLALVNNQRSNNIAFVDSNAPLTSDNSSSHGPDSNSQNNMSLLKEETKGNGIAATMVPSERTFLPSDLPKLTTNLVQEPNNLQVPTKRPLHQRVASDDDALATLPSPATSVHDFPAALHVKHAPPVRKISSSSLNADNNHLLHNRSSSEGHLLKDNPAVEHYQRKGNLQTSDDTGPMIGHHTLQQVLSKLGLSKATEIIGHYVILKTIGMGAFSKVKLAIDLNTCKKVAIKMIATKGIRDSERLKASVSREVELLKYVGHPNIVGLLDTIDTPTHLCLVLEYVSGGELFDYVNDHYESSTEEESKFIFLQLVNTVEYLHENNIVHRDLKLENILIDSSISSSNGPIIKLTDFGLAKFIDKSSPLLTTRCGSEEYAAPELISGNPYDGRKTDIWSLGVILYALLVGYLPFNLEPNHTRKQFFSKIIRVDFTFPNRENESGRRSKISDEAKDLVKKILQNNPQKRLSLSEIKNHPWLNGVAI